VTITSSATRQPELSSPPSSDSPIFPQPRIAVRRLMPASLRSRLSRGRDRDEPSRVAREQVDAREARPLTVWLE
jgi:hypothetical protein